MRNLSTAIEKRAARDAGMVKTRRMYKAASNGYEVAKQAEFGDYAKKVTIGAGSLALGGAILGVGNMGMQAIQKGLESLTNGRDKAKGVSEMLRVNPQLAKEDKTKVLQAYDTLWRFNKDVASDPLSSASFVQKVVDYGGVTSDEVKKMVDMRKAMRDAESKEQNFSMGSMGPVTGLYPGR